MTVELINNTITKLENEIATAPIEHRYKLYEVLLRATELKRWHSEQPQTPIGIPDNTNILDAIRDHIDTALIASKELVIEIVTSDEFKTIVSEAVKKAVKAK